MNSSEQIERLRAEAVAADIRIENDKLEFQRIYAVLRSHAEITQKAEAELAVCKADAERYRWLRNPTQPVGLVLDKVVGGTPADESTGTGGYRNYEYRAGDELDAAIDKAMKGEQS